MKRFDLFWSMGSWEQHQITRARTYQDRGEGQIGVLRRVRLRVGFRGELLAGGAGNVGGLLGVDLGGCDVGVFGHEGEEGGFLDVSVFGVDERRKRGVPRSQSIRED